MSQLVLRVHESEAPVRDSRGGTHRILISPTTVQASQLILGRAAVPIGGRVLPHAHDYSEETFYVLKGHGRVFIEGQQALDFHAGHAVLIPKGAVHSIENTGDEEIEVVFASAPLAPNPGAGHRDIQQGVAQ